MRSIARCPPSGGGYFAPTGPTINLDLTKSMLDPNISFARASGRTYFDKNGIMQMAAANEWPVEYDPETGECLGRSVWGQSTNLVKDSIYGSITWGGVTLTEDNETICPDGSKKSYCVDFSSGQGGVAACDNITLGNFSQQQKYIFSLWIKTTGVVQLYVINHSSEGNEEVAAYCTVESIGSFKRFTISANSGHYFACNLRLQNDQSDVKAWFWGCQFESGEVATPYIPTSGSSATRAFDSAYIPLGTLNDYSFLADVGLKRNPGMFGDSCYALGTCSLDGNVRATSIRAEKLNSGAADLCVNTGSGISISKGIDFGNDFTKMVAVANKSNNTYIMTVSGSSVYLTGLQEKAISNPVLSIGNYTPAGPGNPLNGWIRGVKFWNRAISQYEILGLSNN